MSPKYSRLTAGLTALGLFGLAATRAARSAEPPPTPVTPHATAPSSVERVLLKTDGRVLRGVITEEGADYVVRQRAGEFRLKKFDVEQVLGSTAEVYRYKRSLVPEADPDEHLKLAKWCLAQNLQGEAKVEVLAVLALSPKTREAKAMLASIEAGEARLAHAPRVDDGVVRTGGEMPARRAMPAGAPSEIDPSVLQQARRELGVSTVPVIFDLSPAIAAKRADQFARVVHPVLQAACARCHAESYDGAFQLVQVRSRKDMTANVFRANLDATLRLVDPANPSQSELLSSALLPHGKAPAKRPIFGGSNDPGFQILSAWVNSLRTNAGGPAAGGRFGAPAPTASVGEGSVFGADRNLLPAGPSVSQVPTANPVPAIDFGKLGRVQPPSRYVPGRGMVLETAPPSADEFPVPFAAGGAGPTRDPALTPAATTAPLPPLPGGLPADDPAAGPSSKTPAKPVKIDPALLEKALMNRNGGR